MMIVLLVLMTNGGITSRSILLLEQYLVPTYTTCVLLYLAAVALRPHLVDYYCWKRLFSRFASDEDDNDQQLLRKQKRRQLRSLSTAATLPLEQEEEDEFVGQEAANESSQQQQEQQVQQQPIDLSGAYKLLTNDNFEGFLAVQGLPWALRRAANAARPVHRITHVGCHLTIKIEGIIESQTSYIINGPPVETNVRGRIFRDAVSYLTRAAVIKNDVNFANGAAITAVAAASGTETKENTSFMNKNNTERSNNNNNNNNSCHHDDETDNNGSSRSNDNEIVGIVVHKEALAPENYTITVQRQLSVNRQEIVMTSTAFFRDGRDPVRCIQQFQRVVEMDE
jgi:hypothetical protein